MEIRKCVGADCDVRLDQPVPVCLSLIFFFAFFGKDNAKQTRSTHGKLTCFYKDLFLRERVASVSMLQRCRPLYDEHSHHETPCISVYFMSRFHFQLDTVFMGDCL